MGIYAWITDELLQNITQVNNLSETAFFVLYQDNCQLRWFTPSHEVDLCGWTYVDTQH